MHICRLQLHGSIWLVNTETPKCPQAIRHSYFLSGERLSKLLLTDDLKSLLSVDLSIKL